MKLWVKLDVDFLLHPKFVAAVDKGGSAAVHLWASALAYAKKHRTGGRLSHVQVNAIPGPAQGRWRARALQALLDVGLLDQVADGYVLHDYADWHPAESRPAVEPEQSHRKDKADPEQSHDTKIEPPPTPDPINDSADLASMPGASRARARAVPLQSKSKSGEGAIPRVERASPSYLVGFADGVDAAPREAWEALARDAVTVPPMPARCKCGATADECSVCLDDYGHDCCPSCTHGERRLQLVKPARGVPKRKAPSAPAAPRRWRNVAHAFPDWQPNEFHAALAAKYGKNLKLEAAKYRDHEFKDPKTDPDKTFNNWLRRD